MRCGKHVNVYAGLGGERSGGERVGEGEVFRSTGSLDRRFGIASKRNCHDHFGCLLLVKTVLKSLLSVFTYTQNAPATLRGTYQMKFSRKSKPL